MGLDLLSIDLWTVPEVIGSDTTFPAAPFVIEKRCFPSFQFPSACRRHDPAVRSADFAARDLHHEVAAIAAPSPGADRAVRLKRCALSWIGTINWPQRTVVCSMSSS